jgi:hypothetical protein
MPGGTSERIRSSGHWIRRTRIAYAGRTVPAGDFLPGADGVRAGANRRIGVWSEGGGTQGCRPTETHM